MCSFELFEQIPNAVLMEQNDDNIIILEEYLTHCYKMICMYLSKYELIHDKMSPVLVLSCCRLCSFWSENILYLLKILHTSFIMFPCLRNPEAHNLLHQILGKKNKQKHTELFSCDQLLDTFNVTRGTYTI